MPATAARAARDTEGGVRDEDSADAVDPDADDRGADRDRDRDREDEEESE